MIKTSVVIRDVAKIRTEDIPSCLNVRTVPVGLGSTCSVPVHQGILF